MLGLALLALTAIASGSAQVPTGPDLAASTLAERVARLATETRDPDDGVRRAAILEMGQLYLELAGTVESEGAGTGEAFLSLSATLAYLPDSALPAGLTSEHILEYGVEVARRLGLQTQGAGLALRLAHGLRSAGQMARAEEVLVEALDSFPQAPLPRPYLQLAHAELLRERGDFDLARRALELGQGALVEAPVHDQARLRLAGARAEIHLRLGLLELAAADIEAVRQMSAGRPGRELPALFYRLQYDLAIHDFEGILERVNATLQHESVDLESPGVRARLGMYAGVAQSELAREGRARAEDARATLENARQLTPDPQTQTTIDLTLVDLALRAGQLDEAGRIAASVSVRLTDAQPAPHQVADLAALESQLAFARGSQPVVLEACKAELERAFRTLIASWRRIPTTPGGIGFLYYGSRRRLLSELVRTSLALGDPADALRWLLEAQQQSTLVRRLEAPAVNLEELRHSLLDEGTGLLVYLPALDRSHVFAIDRDRIVHAELPALDEIDILRGQLESELFASPAGLDAERSRSRRDRIHRIGCQLADQLLPEAVREQADGWTHVLVCGAELLGHVPFEALSLGRGGEPGEAALLGAQWSITYMPSVPLGCFLESRRAARSAEPPDLDCIVFAAPESSPPGANQVSARDLRPAVGSLEALPFGESEREMLTAAFQQDRTRVFAGPQASIASLRRASSTTSHMLEFLTHTVHSPTRQRPAALVLAASDQDPGLLWCEDAELVPAPALTVLFSCGTAQAPIRRGDEGANQLGSAFLLSGAQCVVSSRAPLAYEAVLSLARTFHARLAQGDPPAEALRRARESLAAEPATSDPFYHATIQAVGLGHRPVF